MPGVRYGARSRSIVLHSSYVILFLSLEAAMATAARDRSARSRIREYLTQHGPVEDPSGGATALLKDAVGYGGNDVAFIQLITAMDKAAEIHREIRGKRTFK